MKSPFGRLAFLGLISCGLTLEICVIPGVSQYAISTRAGLINRIQGQSFIQRTHDGSYEPAAPGLQMADGDRLGTSFMSRAEILLNPAAYLRLDELTMVRALNTSLLATRFELTQGNLLIQAGRPLLPGRPRASRGGRGNIAGKMSEALAFEIVTPHGILTFHKEGLFRITIEPSATRIDVLVGEVVLGERSQSQGKKSRTFKSRKQLRLTGNNATDPSVRDLKVRSYDEFDSWSFPIAIHGTAVRIEGRAGATWAIRPEERHPITPVTVFQMRVGQTLSTENASYLELRINYNSSLYLNESTKVRAVSDETDTAVFELLRGGVIVDSYGGIYPMRPIKIVSRQGTFAFKPGSLARVDVDESGTAVRTSRGEVRWGTTAIRKGRRLQLTGTAEHPQVSIQNWTEETDNFDRWSAGILRAGSVTRYEGRVILERPGGGKLTLDSGDPQIRPQLLKGGHMRTENGGRAVLGFEQAWLHLNENSEIVATGSPPKEADFELLRGAVIFYVEKHDGIFGSIRNLKVLTPHGLADISKSGVYRLDVDASGTTIRVREGSLSFAAHPPAAANPAIKVGNGETARFLSGTAAIVSKREDPPDAFDTWSIGARAFPVQSINRKR